MANRYWVGGTGTWDGAATANWSDTSGGASGASAPVAADLVFFDANSGTGTCTVNSGAVCTDVTVGSATVTVSLGANFSPSRYCYLGGGSLVLNTYALSCGFLYTTGAAVSSIDFGVGSFITVSGTGTNIINFQATVNTTGTTLVKITDSSATGKTIQPLFCVLNYQIVAGTGVLQLAVASGQRFGTLDFTGFSGTLNTNSAGSGVNLYGDLILSPSMTVPSQTGPLVFQATSGTQKITTNGKAFDQPLTFGGAGGTVQLQDNLTTGATRTVTLTAGTLDLNNLTLTTGLFASTNSNARTLAFGTGGIIVTGNSGNVLNISDARNFSYTGTSAFNFNYSGSTGTRNIYYASTALNGSATTAMNCTISAGTDIVSLGPSNPWHIKNLDFTGFAGTLSNNAGTIYGNTTFSSGMTLTAGAAALTFAATSGTQQITTAGKTLDFPLTFNGIGGTFAFQDALTQGSTRAFTLTNGTVQLKDSATSTVGAFTTSGANQKFLQSTTPGSQATLSQASGTVNAQNVNAQDIDATGGARWNLVNGSVNYGNLSGWYVAHQQNAYYPSGFF